MNSSQIQAANEKLIRTKNAIYYKLSELNKKIKEGEEEMLYLEMLGNRHEDPFVIIPFIEKLKVLFVHYLLMLPEPPDAKTLGNGLLDVRSEVEIIEKNIMELFKKCHFAIKYCQGIIDKILLSRPSAPSYVHVPPPAPLFLYPSGQLFPPPPPLPCQPLQPLSPQRKMLMEFLSDHTPQAMLFELYEEKDGASKIKLQVNGATYNLLDCCFSKEQNGGKFANNPWNIQETFEEYVKRKTNQLKKIFQIIERDSIDFMYMQEIDFLYPNNKFSEKEQNELKSLRENFISELKEEGYDLIMPPPSALSRQQPLATIYRKSTFEYKDKSYGVLQDRGCSRGMVDIMTHKTSGQTVALMNLHLSYSESYFSSIASLMKLNTKDGMVTFVGGDTNHPLGEIDGFLARSEKYGVTNIQESKGILSLYDDKGHPKCYDGFFAAPHPEGIVKVKFDTCEYFVSDEKNNIRIETIKKGEHTTELERSSEKGKPLTQKKVAITVETTDAPLTENQVQNKPVGP